MPSHLTKVVVVFLFCVVFYMHIYLQRNQIFGKQFKYDIYLFVCFLFVVYLIYIYICMILRKTSKNVI